MQCKSWKYEQMSYCHTHRWIYQRVPRVLLWSALLKMKGSATKLLHRRSSGSSVRIILLNPIMIPTLWPNISLVRVLGKTRQLYFFLTDAPDDLSVEGPDSVAQGETVRLLLLAAFRFKRLPLKVILRCKSSAGFPAPTLQWTVCQVISQCQWAL